LSHPDTARLSGPGALRARRALKRAEGAQRARGRSGQHDAREALSRGRGPPRVRTDKRGRELRTYGARPERHQGGAIGGPARPAHALGTSTRADRTGASRRGPKAKNGKSAAPQVLVQFKRLIRPCQRASARAGSSHVGRLRTRAVSYEASEAGGWDHELGRCAARRARGGGSTSGADGSTRLACRPGRGVEGAGAAPVTVQAGEFEALALRNTKTASR